MRLIKIRKTHIFLETHGSVFQAKQYDNDNGDASPCDGPYLGIVWQELAHAVICILIVMEIKQ